MYQIDFSRPVWVHFIGIGGISMSGLALVLLQRGFRVTGSDMKASSLTELLESHGAEVTIGQRAENIDPACDVVVYTAAVHPDNPELARALELQVPVLTRAQLLGEMMRNYDTPVAVAGTHGKTTTTSMLSHVTMRAGLDPTISVGGILESIGGNIRVGHTGTFIVEACEYTNSFLSFYPKIGIILNIDADHLDFFKDLDEIRASFHAFAKLIPSDGLLVINGDIPDLEDFISDLVCPVVTCSLKDGDVTARSIIYDENGCGSFDAVYKGKNIGRISLHVPGEHNVSNALFAVAVAMELGIDPAVTAAGLADFSGTDRRFQKKGVFDGITVIDDYAHHPTEIKATLKAAARFPHRKLWCLFQPHTYTRTAALLDEFAEALSLADEVVLADIYAAREKNTIGISSADLRDRMLAQGSNARYIPTFDEIVSYIRENAREGDLVITMGAGDIYTVGEKLLA